MNVEVDGISNATWQSTGNRQAIGVDTGAAEQTLSYNFL
jgi:hypothetical protein